MATSIVAGTRTSCGFLGVSLLLVVVDEFLGFNFLGLRYEKRVNEERN
ncbi:hypothetical protein HanRHA438_Chr16g0775101 [Helianthus annuus]|nr:hypothetical protein HanRHA438_Chr16g0775101 [Helianthus annuus]